ADRDPEAGNMKITMRLAVALVAALALLSQARGQGPVHAEPGKIGNAGEPIAAADAPAVVFEPDLLPPSPDRFWVTADYLAGWLRADRLPPLVTTSPPGTARVSAGVPGQPGTTLLFGD